MNTRRELGDTLADVAGRIEMRPGPGLRATSLEVTLPLEISLSAADGQAVLLADVPRFVYRTAFDPRPGRLTMRWGEGESA